MTKSSKPKNRSEIRERLAGILGYCQLNGDLHNPNNFNKAILRGKYGCPDCNKTVGTVDFKRSKELQWVLNESKEENEEESKDEQEEEEETDDDSDEEEQEDEDGEDEDEE